LIDPVQLVVSVMGVSLIVGLVWLAAGGTTASVGDEAAVRQRLARELPGFLIGALAIDSNGRSAIAQSQDGAEIALLFATGRRMTLWSLPAADIQWAELRTFAAGNAILELATGDFTRSRLKLDLSDAASARGLLPGVLQARAST
jgi:hypothetical protein